MPDNTPDLATDVLNSLQHISISIPQTSVFGAQIVTNDLIYDLVFAAADPASLLRLARTCKPAYAAVRDFFSRAYSIDKHLARFFGSVNDALAFRSLQARTSTLISGSSALQFLARTTYEESDLDLYAPLSHYREVGRWLLAHGYHYTPNSAQDPDFEVASDDLNAEVGAVFVYLDDFQRNGVATVFTFHKPSKNSDTPLQVQLIVAESSPMEIILFFHSTVVLNVISWDHAYSLYPLATFDHRSSLLLLRAHQWPRSATFKPIIAKYSKRGYHFLEKLEHPSSPSSPSAPSLPLTSTEPNLVGSAPFYPNIPRWIADGRSWVLPLSTDGLTLGSSSSSSSNTPSVGNTRQLSRDPCYLTTWQLSLQPVNNPRDANLPRQVPSTTDASSSGKERQKQTEKEKEKTKFRAETDFAVTAKAEVFEYEYVVFLEDEEVDQENPLPNVDGETRKRTDVTNGGDSLGAESADGESENENEGDEDRRRRATGTRGFGRGSVWATLCGIFDKAYFMWLREREKQKEREKKGKGKARDVKLFFDQFLIDGFEDVLEKREAWRGWR